MRIQRRQSLSKVRKHSDFWAFVVDMIIAIGSLMIAGALVLLLSWNS